MAKNPENAMRLMEAVWPSAIKRVNEEVAAMQKIASADNITIAHVIIAFTQKKFVKHNMI